MNEYKNRVLSLAELAVSEGRAYGLKITTEATSRASVRELCHTGNLKAIAYISTADVHGTPITPTARRGAAGCGSRRRKKWRIYRGRKTKNEV